MASTNKTTNYELSQFIETDRPAWLTDYNGDMRTIDSIMKAISDAASGASGSISALADRMSTAEGNITTNTNDIATLDARADSLEAQAQSTAGTIANIQTEQTAQNLGIEAATELGYNLARPYDSASTYAVGAYVLFQNTLYKCVTAIATGEAFDPTKWLAIKATDEIAAGGYTLPIASASQLGGVKVGNGLSIDPASGILSASGGISEFIDMTSSNIFEPVNPHLSVEISALATTQTRITLFDTAATFTFNKIHYYRSNNCVIIAIDFNITGSTDSYSITNAVEAIARTAIQLNHNSNYYSKISELSNLTPIINEPCILGGNSIVPQNITRYDSANERLYLVDHTIVYNLAGAATSNINFTNVKFVSFLVGYIST